MKILICGQLLWNFTCKIHEKNLAHRLSLFVFFWNANNLPKRVKEWNLKEPLRAVFITNPRNFVYRIYYNQATSSNDGTLKLVNWFDGNNLGLNSEPILGHFKSIYKNFNKRTFTIPVVHVSFEEAIREKRHCPSIIFMFYRTQVFDVFHRARPGFS